MYEGRIEKVLNMKVKGKGLERCHTEGWKAMGRN
jgi:hypothetical protein